MKKRWIKYVVMGLLVIVVMAQASTAIGKPLLSTATYPYYVGSSSAKAASGAYNTETQNQMKCLYDSWTSPYTTINVIGFTWVACTAKCRRGDGTEYRVDWDAWNPGYITGSANNKGNYEYRGCQDGETEIWVAEAWHDFNHTGSPVWRPSTNQYKYP